MSEKPERCNGARKADRPLASLNVLEPSGLTAGKVRVSRMSRRRAAVLIAVHVLIIAHVVQWWITGRTVSPVEPSESMYTLEQGQINAGFIFFAASLLATLVLGRFVCGWGCHIVALQDLCGWIMKKLGVRPKPFRSRLLIFVPLIAALYMFVWPTFKRVVVRPILARLEWSAPPNPFPGFSDHLITTNFWQTFPGVGVAVPFLLICGFATVYFLGSKGYCTYACPYGGFFGLADKFAPGSIRVTDACDACGHCTATCTSNVRVHAEVRDFGMVVDPGCMKCLDCVSVCPQDALYFGFGRPSLAAKPRTDEPAPPRYDLSWPQEFALAAVFLASFLAVRGVYDAVPFLMALGVAGIVTFGTLKLTQLWHRQSVSVQNLRLKVAGRIRRVGWIFIVAGAAVIALVAHSGVIRYHQFRGDRDYARTDVPEETVLAGEDLSAVMTNEMRAAADRGLRHLRVCDRWGLLDTANLKRKLAWLALLLDQREEAIGCLQSATDLSHDRWRTAMGLSHGDWQIDYYLGSVLSLEGRYAEAIDPYRRALSADPDSVKARFKLGNALAAAGDLDEAKSAWQTILDSHPAFIAARHNLAGALRHEGHLEQAVQQYALALQHAPNNAETYFQMGVTLTGMGRPQAASRHFRRAVELDPKYREFLE